MSDWRNPDPKTKYRMMWGGEWRPVTNMMDAHNVPTTMPMRAAKAVLFITHDEWVAVAVAPGEIVMDPNYKTETWD